MIEAYRVSWLAHPSSVIPSGKRADRRARARNLSDGGAHYGAARFPSSTLKTGFVASLLRMTYGGASLRVTGEGLRVSGSVRHD